MRFFLVMLLTIFFVHSLPLSSQDVNSLDSLERALKSASGKEKIDFENKLSWEYKFNDPAKALQYGQRALKASQKSGYEYGLMLAYRNLTAVYYLKGKTDSCLVYASKALEYAEQQNDKYQLGKIHNLIAIANRNKENFKKAMARHDTALKYFRQINDSSEIVGNLHNKALIYEYVNDFVRAFNIYKSVLDYELQAGNKEGIMRTALQMANIAQKNDDYFNARKYFGMALKYVRQTGNTRRKSATLHNMATFYEEVDSTEKAIEFYKKALKINRKYNYKDYLANNLHNLGNFYADSQPEKARGYYKQSAELYKNIGRYRDYVQAVNGVASTYLNAKKYKKANEYARKALHIADSLGFATGLKIVYANLSDIMRKQGEYEQALMYNERYIFWKDSLQRLEEKEKLANIQARYDFRRMGKENRKLQAENELKAMKNRQQRLIIYSVLGFSLLVILLAIVLFRSRKRLKKMNAELNQQQEEIRKQSELLEKELATKDKFFSVIAHDLRNPFMGILGFSEILVEKSEERKDEDPEYHEMSVEINKSVKEIYGLLENLLHWAKTQRHDIEMDMSENVSLAGVTDKAVEQLKLSAEAKGIELNKNVPADLTAYTDKQALQTIIRNLLNNSIKYSHQNSWAEIKAEEQDDKVVMSVKDNGVGMDEATQQTVFNIVGGYSKAGTKDEFGSGLGLALCKELVEKQGEKIWFESTPGKGSIFYFSLKKCKE